MKTNRALLATMTAMLLPIGAMAGENINYTFFDLKYVDNGIDESYSETFEGESLSLDVDGSGGFAVLGSLAINENWHVFADYAATDVDLKASAMLDDLEDSVTIGGDVDDWRIGLGFNTALGPDLDGIVQVAWENRGVDFGSVTVLDETTDLDLDDDGVGVMIGLRGNLSNKFELNGNVRYSQVLGLDLAAEAEDDILDNDLLYAVGGIYHMDDMFSLGANVEVGDSTAWYLFARVAFGS